MLLKTAQASLEALFGPVSFHLTALRTLPSAPRMKLLVGFIWPYRGPSLPQNKSHKRRALWYIFVFHFS